MKTTVSVRALLLTLLTLFVLFGLLVSTTFAAQNAGQGSAGAGDQDRTQDQDGLQDPDAHDGDTVPQQDRVQDQDQDQDQLQDGTGDNCIGDCDGTPDQDQLQTQDRDRVQDPAVGDGDGPDQDRDQARDRDQVRADTPAALQQFVDDATADADDTQVRARTATQAFVAAENLLGQNGPRMSEMAVEMNQAMVGMHTREAALQEQSRMARFLFGTDQTAVKEMEQTMTQNQERLQEMERLLQECSDCDPDAVAVLQQQRQEMEQEQNRLQTVVNEAAGTRGLFGFLFGWMR